MYMPRCCAVGLFYWIQLSDNSIQPATHRHGLLVRIFGELAGYSTVIRLHFFHLERRLLIPGHIPEWIALFAGLAIACVVCRSRKRRFHPLRWLRSVSRSSTAAMAILFAVSILGRLAYWGTNPVPPPIVQDEFAYLLGADTYVHGRLTNPTPEFWTHFETYHELMRPTYMSKYPPGQSLFLALGQFLFGTPFAGVLISCGLMCAALYWALAAMMPRRWAFLAGLIVAVRIGWWSYWDDSYWGGAVAAFAGCLVVGAAWRLRSRITAWDAGVLGFGLWLLAITRPYEGVLLAVPVCISLLIWMTRISRPRELTAALATFAIVCGAGVAWVCYSNGRVTGHPLTLPAVEFTRQYEATPLLLFLKTHAITNTEPVSQKNHYLSIGLPAYLEARNPQGFLAHTVFRLVTIWSFFIGPCLTLLLFGILRTAGKRKLRWLWFTLAFMVLGWESEVWENAHYYAPALAVMFAIGIFGLRALYSWRRRERTGAVIVSGCLLGLAITSVLRLVLVPVNGYFNQPWLPGVHDHFRVSRGAILQALGNIPGNHLVIVHYASDHDPKTEWVYNGYDIPSQRIIWAHRLEPEEPDGALICHYADRHVWILEASDAASWSVEQAKEALQPVDTTPICK